MYFFRLADRPIDLVRYLLEVHCDGESFINKSTVYLTKGTEKVVFPLKKYKFSILHDRQNSIE